MKTSRENRRLVWGLIAAALAASGVGSAFDLYDTHPWFDKALHAYATFAYGAVLTDARNQRRFLILTIASLGLTLGVLWEVLEWAYDQFVRPNAIPGKTDTILDLVADTIGGLAAGFACLRMLKG